jgi:hypothetical protein
MDMFKPAIDYVYDMAELNQVRDKVTGYCSNQIQDLPKHEKFDLILGNPPHVITEFTLEEAHIEDAKNGYKPRDKSQLDDVNRILVDKDWKIHEEFFNNIKYYCNFGCDILISNTGHVEKNLMFAEKGNLKYIGSIDAPSIQKDAVSATVQISWFKYQG